MTTAAPNVVWQAHPGPQEWLISCPVADILCGGARGGGKTIGMMLRWVARQATYGKDCHGVWFRRSVPEIEGAQKEMLKRFPLLGATYGAQERTWTFPSGATLKLRYLESDADASRYQGHETTDLFFDDLGTWPSPAPIDFLRGTLRSPAGVPCCMVSSANPCGAGHEWIKARYLTPSPPMRPFLTSNPDYPELPPVERVFIPSTLSDNPSLGGEHGAAYKAQLALSGPAHIVEAWLTGNWDVEPGGAMLEAEWLRQTYDDPMTDARRRGKPVRVILSIDPAEDVGAANDETGIVCGALHGYPCLLMHAEAVKMLLDPLERRVEALCQAFQPDMVLIEKKSVGGPLAQNLKRRPGWRWPVIAVDPGQLSKAERLWAQAPWFQGGRVLLPSARAQALLPRVPPLLTSVGTMEWADYVREMTRFTGNRKAKERDNRVDATSQMLKHFGVGDLSALCA